MSTTVNHNDPAVTASRDTDTGHDPGDVVKPVTPSRVILANPAVSEPVADHRTDYWAWIEQHAEQYKRGLLLGLRDFWRDCNRDYFDDRMHLPYITLTVPSAPQIYGQCCSVSSWGSRLEIKLRPSLLAGTHPHLLGAERVHRERFVYDILLHEMIHQHVMEHEPDVNENSYRGHGPVFTAHCNRIGAQLGLTEVVVRNRKGKPEKPRSAYWPHNVRPAEWYGRRYKPFAPVTASGDTPDETSSQEDVVLCVPAGYLAATIAPDDTGNTVTIDFEPESGEVTDPTLRIRLEADAAVQLTDLLNGFFNDDHQPTPYVQLLELLDQCSAVELLELNGLLIRAFSGQDGAK